MWPAPPAADQRPARVQNPFRRSRCPSSAGRAALALHPVSQGRQPTRPPLQRLASAGPRRGVLSDVRSVVELIRCHVCRDCGGNRGGREVRQLLPGVDREDLLEDDAEMVDRRDGSGNQPRQGRHRRPERAERNGRTTSTGAAPRIRRTRPRTTKARHLARSRRTARARSTGAPSRTTRTAAERSHVPRTGTTRRETRSSRTSASTPRSSGRRRAHPAPTTSSPSQRTSSATSSISATSRTPRRVTTQT